MQEARVLGLSGWASNRRDGTVEGEAQGSQENMSLFLKKLKAGPPQARVDLLETRRLEVKSGPAEFEII